MSKSKKATAAKKQTTKKVKAKKAATKIPEFSKPKDLGVFENIMRLTKQHDKAFDQILTVHLSGDHKQVLRQDIMNYLTGVFNPSAKCGIKALEPLLKSHFNLQAPGAFGPLQIIPAGNPTETKEAPKRTLPVGSKQILEFKIPVQVENSQSMTDVDTEEKPEVEFVFQLTDTKEQEAREKEKAMLKPSTAEMHIDEELTAELKKANTFEEFSMVHKKATQQGLIVTTLKGTVIKTFIRGPLEEGKPDSINYKGGIGIYVYMIRKYFVVAKVG